MVDLDIAAARPQEPLPAPFHTWALPDGAPWTDFHREHGGNGRRSRGEGESEVVEIAEGAAS